MAGKAPYYDLLFIMMEIWYQRRWKIKNLH